MNTNTAWNKSGKWYDKLVGKTGHYFHEHVILPQIWPLLNLKSGDSLLDLGCGQGVLANKLPAGVNYLGLDASATLIDRAKKQNPKYNFQIADVSKSLNISEKFSHAIFMLSLQNMRHAALAIHNACILLKPGGKLFIILNHPAFRIPRQSSWGIDDQSKQQYRRINRYLSPLEVPINMHPGDPNSEFTWSFHHPISAYFTWLKNEKMQVVDLQEWISDKESVGKAAKMENRSRSEFPMFMAIVATKN